MLNKFKGKQSGVFASKAFEMLEKLYNWTEEQMYPGAPCNLVVILDAENECALVDGKPIEGTEKIMDALAKYAVIEGIGNNFITKGNWASPADPPESDIQKYAAADAGDFSIWNAEILKTIYATWGMLLNKKKGSIYWIEYEGESEMMGAEEFSKDDTDAIQKFMNMSKWGDENKDFDLEEEE